MAQRVTNEQIISAYQRTGSVWKAAKLLGIVGQSVHERLRALDYQMPSRAWTDEEYAELAALSAAGCTIGDIAYRLGRPYAGVAIKLSRRNIGVGTRRSGPPLKQRRFIYTKAHAKKFKQELLLKSESVRQYARANSLRIDSVVKVLQRFEPDFWYDWTRRHGLPESQTCPNCDQVFYPLTKKQVCCSRRCSDTNLRDRTYFGGRRKETIGLAEGVCQLCGRTDDKGLSSHHVLGKDNDPNNESLIALCRGCHKVVELLAVRKFVDQEAAWESLISLVILRRSADKHDSRYAALSVFVEIEHHTKAEWLEMYPEDDPEALPSPDIDTPKTLPPVESQP